MRAYIYSPKSNLLVASQARVASVALLPDGISAELAVIVSADPRTYLWALVLYDAPITHIAIPPTTSASARSSPSLPPPQPPPSPGVPWYELPSGALTVTHHGGGAPTHTVAVRLNLTRSAYLISLTHGTDPLPSALSPAHVLWGARCPPKRIASSGGRYTICIEGELWASYQRPSEELEEVMRQWMPRWASPVGESIRGGPVVQHTRLALMAELGGRETHI